MAKNFISVSVKNMDSLKKSIEKYADNTARKIEIFAEKLAQYGVEMSKFYISDFDAIFTGELLESISKEKLPSDKNHVVFVVKSNSKHAIFVEMGTGKVGAESGYMGKLPAVYAQGKKIFATKDGRYGWIYYNEVYGKWLFTEGMESRPFMYLTSLEMQNKVIEIAKEVFG